MSRPPRVICVIITPTQPLRQGLSDVGQLSLCLLYTGDPSPGRGLRCTWEGTGRVGRGGGREFHVPPVQERDSATGALIFTFVIAAAVFFAMCLFLCMPPLVLLPVPAQCVAVQCTESHSVHPPTHPRAAARHLRPFRAAWNTWLVISNQTTIEFHYNRSMYHDLRRKGVLCSQGAYM